MAEPKTQRNDGDVDAVIAGIEDDERRDDARALLEIMTRVTGERPAMWGSSMIGFGERHYEYASGRQADWFKVGFSPRKQSLTLYTSDHLSPDDPLLERLGRHTTGKSCIYIKRLDDVDTETLEKLVERTFEGAG